MDENRAGRTTPEPGPAQTTVATAVTKDSEASAECVVLGVSAPLRTLAVRGGMVGAGDGLSMPADRYMAAAHRLVHEWSRIVPVAIAIHKSLAAGVEWPATLTPELLDVLLVHDHECLLARERLRAKQVAWEQAQQALRARNTDQDLDAAQAHRAVRPEGVEPAPAGSGAANREESGQSGAPQDREDRSEAIEWDR